MMAALPAPGSLHQSLPRSLNPIRNPEGWAAFGSVLGNIVGGVSGALLSLGMLKRPPSVDLIVSPATIEEAEQVVQKTSAELAAETAAWARRSYAISGVLATLGSAIGAYIGAAPHQKTRAAVGAAIGTGAARSLNVIFVPPIGIPGIVAGAVGAWVGARGAEPAYGGR